MTARSLGIVNAIRKSALGEVAIELLLRNRDRHAIPSLDGPWRPNRDLETAPILASGLAEPDDVVLDPAGTLFVSDSCRVLKLSGPAWARRDVVREFDHPVGGMAWHRDGSLAVCVEEEGVIFVGGPFEGARLDSAGGRRLRCATAVCIGPDGELFVAEGSRDHVAASWAWDLMEKRSSGRVLRFDPRSGEASVLLDDRPYPHGLALTHDGRSLLVTESWGHTVSRYPLQGKSIGPCKPVFRNLPGYPARIVPAADGGYWLSLFAMRTHLVEFLLTEDEYRLAMMRSVDERYWIRPALAATDSFLEPLQGGGIKQLGITKPWAPPRSYGLVAKLDGNLELLRTWHSRVGGDRHGITGVREHGGTLYVVSKGHKLVLAVSGGSAS